LRLGRTLLALCVIVGGTVGLASRPAMSAFSATTGTSGGTVTSSGQFCTEPPTRLVSVGDSWTDSAATTVAHGSDTFLKVSASSSTGNTRTWIRFALPGIPAGCVLNSALLNLRARTPVSGRIIDVYRGNPAAPQWASATITWATQPTGVGTAVGSSSLTTAGSQSWTVTAHVTRQYIDGNNGFVLQDRAEGSGSAAQIYEDLQNTTYPPELVLTWN
jgi:hypothetical protein